MSVRESVLSVLRDGIAPSVGKDGIPRCSDDCEQHDGKRCRLLGCRPDEICEPAMEDMGAVIERAYSALIGAKP